MSVLNYLCNNKHFECECAKCFGEKYDRNNNCIVEIVHKIYRGGGPISAIANRCNARVLLL